MWNVYCLGIAIGNQFPAFVQQFAHLDGEFRIVVCLVGHALHFCKMLFYLHKEGVCIVENVQYTGEVVILHHESEQKVFGRNKFVPVVVGAVYGGTDNLHCFLGLFYAWHDVR